MRSWSSNARWWIAVWGALLLGIVALVIGINGLSFGAGWSGTTGTLTTVTCAEVGTDGGQHQECHGGFLAHNGQFSTTWITAGGRTNWDQTTLYTAQLSADHQSVTAIGTPAIAGSIGGILVGLALIGLAVPTIAYGAVRAYRRDRGETLVIPLSRRLIPVWVALPLIVASIVCWAISGQSG
jgi:uncharacterized membrane protein YidH (DUF202 family)